NICQHQLPLLIIDNTHALSTDALEIILHLSNLENNGSKLISALLFSEPEISPYLEGTHFSGINTLQQLEVPTLNKEHTELYIQHRLMMAGYQGKSPLSRRQFRKLHRDSGGIPGQINTLAQQTLIQKSSNNKDPGKTSRTYKFGVVSLTMLGILSLIAILIFQQDINQLLNTNATKTHLQTRAPLALPAVNESRPPIMAATSLNNTVEQPTSAEVTPSKIIAPKVVEATKVAMEPQSTIPQEPALSQSSATSKSLAKEANPVSTRSSTAGKPEKIVSTPAPSAITKKLYDNKWLSDQQDDHYTLQLLATHRKAGLEEFANRYQLTAPLAALTTRSNNKDTVHILVQGQYESRQNALAIIKSLPEDIQRLSPWPRQIGQLKTTLISSAQAKIATGSAEALKGAAWLWSRDPSQYTIQLIAADNKEAIVAFSKTLELSLPLAYFRTQRNNKPWHVLVYGEFDNENAARKAIKQLPTHLRKGKPWPKSFGSVHETLSNQSDLL
ncbi:MAG: SPOR domain-containing protein, partial [Gammaproteobacteria bacterium]|nr:SPOR domain-containing protein [Gammaproteobacteria bacterium]